MAARKSGCCGLGWFTLRVGTALAVGCAGSEAERDAAASFPVDASLPSDASMLDAGLSAPTLSELVETLFLPTCVLGRCHITRAPAGDLSFTGNRVTPHAALVNARSSEVPDRMRVVPFDPDASYLIEKLSLNPPSVGSSMPPMGALDPAEIERIRRWILAGALDN